VCIYVCICVWMCVYIYVEKGLGYRIIGLGEY